MQAKVTKPEEGTKLRKTKQPVFKQQHVSDMKPCLSNRAVQRLLAQRSSGDGAFDLDDTTANRINSARGNGQALDSNVQAQMGESIGADFSNVRVHTGSESNQLNEQLGAKAFTTGSDVFFRDGEYSPGSSSGQELIAHELTHVVQQGSGAVPSGDKMAVNAPGDQFEQEADAVAKQVTSAPATAQPAAGVQRQELPEEETQAKRVQREAMAEEEEMAQMQELPEEEKVAAAQMQEMPEEEMIE